MNGEKSFKAQWHHVTYVEIVIPQFGHVNVNFPSVVSAPPGGLVISENICMVVRTLIENPSVAQKYFLHKPPV